MSAKPKPDLLPSAGQGQVRAAHASEEGPSGPAPWRGAELPRGTEAASVVPQLGEWNRPAFPSLGLARWGPAGCCVPGSRSRGFDLPSPAVPRAVDSAVVGE